MSTGYDLRFNLLQMAKDLLVEDYYSKRNTAELVWQNEVTKQESIGSRKTIPFPDIGKFPDVNAIVKIADQLNEFVSNKKL